MISRYSPVADGVRWMCARGGYASGLRNGRCAVPTAWDRRTMECNDGTDSPCVGRCDQYVWHIESRPHLSYCIAVLRFCPLEVASIAAKQHQMGDTHTTKGREESNKHIQTSIFIMYKCLRIYMCIHTRAHIYIYICSARIVWRSSCCRHWANHQ